MAAMVAAVLGVSATGCAPDLDSRRASVIETIWGSTGLPSDEISSLMEDRDGALWKGSYTGGAARLQHGKLTVYTTAEG